MAGEQASLGAYTAGTTTETVTRTIRMRLETSAQKNELVETGIEEYQRMTAYVADILPSFPEQNWVARNTTLYRVVTREFPKDERGVKATIAREAGQKVAEAFDAWATRGKPGERPSFGDGNQMRLSHQDVEIVENDRGWGLKAGFIPYNPVWFHMVDGAYQREYLRRITDEEDDASAGSAELRLEDDGTLWCHLTVSWDVEVYEPAAVSTYLGVDLNDDPLYAAAVVSSPETETETVDAVEMLSGAEYRHHRERVKQKRAEAMERDDLQAIKSTRLTYNRYTDHITNVVSRDVVDLAIEHEPCAIRIEDLTHYRETADDPIHDWPFAEIQTKIAYKSTEAGIPVEVVDPRNTSVTCRRCGQTDPTYRDGVDFDCRRCGYEVHADVNASINIARALNG